MRRPNQRPPGATILNSLDSTHGMFHREVSFFRLLGPPLPNYCLSGSARLEIGEDSKRQELKEEYTLRSDRRPQMQLDAYL